jgi:trehalose synthase
MAATTLSDYEGIVGSQVIEEIHTLAQKVSHKSVKMINSTAVGGGVAEILNRMVPLLNEAGVRTKWDVIKGGETFFSVTKEFHNALHGKDVQISQGMYDTFLEYNRLNQKEMTFNEDVIVVHDPQPAALIDGRDKTSTKWVWRCHIDVSSPHAGVWGFLENYVKRYDASIFSSPRFARQLPIPQYLIPPSIDPLSEKNQDIPQTAIDTVLAKYSIKQDKPIITQISRFDRLKDPLGVIAGYNLAKKYVDCQLVLAGGAAPDDPEAVKVLPEVQARAKDDRDIHVLPIPENSLEINALQRASTVIVQKSLKEGFGLTVTEALWKRKPVIASAVGGIPLQIKNNLTGVLVHSVDGLAYQIRYLLKNPDVMAKLGEYGHEYVRQKFLLTRHLKDYLLLISVLDKPGESIINLR